MCLCTKKSRAVNGKEARSIIMLLALPRWPKTCISSSLANTNTFSTTSDEEDDAWADCGGGGVFVEAALVDVNSSRARDTSKCKGEPGLGPLAPALVRESAQMARLALNPMEHTSLIAVALGYNK